MAAVPMVRELDRIWRRLPAFQPGPATAIDLTMEPLVGATGLCPFASRGAFEQVIDQSQANHFVASDDK